MRILKIIMIVSVLSAVVISSFGCASESEETELLENQLVTVQRGNLTIDITAVGNLALSLKEDLAFEMSGTVAEILVEEGESIEEGQVLAKLDTSEWEEQLEALEDQLTTAERQLIATEREVTADERQLTAKERDLLQAEINLKNAEVALERAEDSWLVTVSAGEKVMRLEKRLEWYLENDPEDSERIEQIREDLEKAWDDFFRLASDCVEAREVTAKEMAVELAQARLEDVQIAIEDAQVAIDDARQGVEDAQKDVDDAQDALDEARSLSPVITAPFDGFITRVNVEGGDEVMTGTVAVQLADPNKFEAEVMVNEMDIFQVKLGGEARVQIDAMPMLTLLAKVTHISPTATIQSGVVNYNVKVEIQSLQSVMPERQEARQEAVQGQVPTMLPEDFQLREGLTVTVSILVDERNDVLLVPNGAIIRRGWETYVQVLKDGVIEERSIVIGISNWRYTEVTDGLSEGERVVIPQATTTPPTTPQQEGPPMMIPGMGRPPQ